MSTNATSIVSVNSDDKKIQYKMNCYNFQMFLLVTIILCGFCLTGLMDLLEIIMELNVSHYLVLRNIMPFSIGLDIL